MLPWSLVLAVVTAGLASLAPIPDDWQDAVLLGCWASVVLTAAAVHLPGGLGPKASMFAAVNAGAWAGAAIACAGAPWDLARALPWMLIALLGVWIAARRERIVLKVVASWLIAVAVLAAGLPATTPTPGYAPDHME